MSRQVWYTQAAERTCCLPLLSARISIASQTLRNRVRQKATCLMASLLHHSEALHVGNLGDGVTDQHLHALFSQAGSVLSAHVMISGDTKKSRGFGLVEMASPEDSQNAIRTIHGVSLDGRALSVRPLPPRMPGWEGDNSRGGGNRSHGLGGGNSGSRW